MKYQIGLGTCIYTIKEKLQRTNILDIQTSKDLISLLKKANTFELNATEQHAIRNALANLLTLVDIQQRGNREKEEMDKLFNVGLRQVKTYLHLL